MTQRHIQSGSAHIVLVVGLVIALFAALGYIFWQNFQVPKKSQTTQISSESSEPAVAKEVYKGERISSTGGTYSIKVPNGWELINDNSEKDSGNDSFDKNYLTTGPGIDGKLTYDEVTPPQVTKSDLGGWGGFAEIFTVSAPSSLPEDGANGTDFKIDNGIVGKKTETITPARPDAEIYATTEDFYSYRYLFQKNGKIVQVQFDVFDSNRSTYRTIIDDVVRSLQIL